MHRILERLDALTSSLVPLLYLAGLMLGSIAYFAGLTLNYELAVGLALASALELHSFLQQRRARAAYTQLQRLADTDPEYEQARHQFRVNAWLLVALLSFSAVTAIAYAAETWTPAPGPLWLRWGQIAARGLAIPALFFAAGLLTPLHSDAADQMRSTSSEMLQRALKATARQWRMRLKRAEQRSADLAPVAVALLEESGDHAAARRIELIAAGLRSAETGAPLNLGKLTAAISAASSASASSASAARSLDPAPPTIPMPQRPLTHEERRRQLEAQQFTDLAEYDPDDADNDDALAYTRQPHPTHPRSTSLSGRAYRNGSSAARIEQAEPRMRYSEIEVDLPTGRTARKCDTPEARRVMNYLDKHSGATVAQVMEKTGVSKPTVRRAYTAWLERNRRFGEAPPATFTEEMAAITQDMLAERPAERVESMQ